MMDKKKKINISYLQKLKKIKHAGIENSSMIRSSPIDLHEIESIKERVKKILGIINQPSKKVSDMLFFIMYDIESDKVRYQISKYLLRQGCHRIQRSIFLANIETNRYEEIKRDLLDVQGCYDNHDSIMIVPISPDLLRSMKIIGKSVDMDIIMKTKNVLFF